MKKKTTIKLNFYNSQYNTYNWMYFPFKMYNYSWIWLFTNFSKIKNPWIFGFCLAWIKRTEDRHFAGKISCEEWGKLRPPWNCPRSFRGLLLGSSRSESCMPFFPFSQCGSQLDEQHCHCYRTTSPLSVAQHGVCCILGPGPYPWYMYIFSCPHDKYKGI